MMTMIDDDDDDGDNDDAGDDDDDDDASADNADDDDDDDDVIMDQAEPHLPRGLWAEDSRHRTVRWHRRQTVQLDCRGYILVNTAACQLLCYQYIAIITSLQVCSCEQ